MRFSTTDTAPVPWKNGGGTTHELALSEVGGKMRWRASLADIGQDGPFSPFPGLARIHTIAEGHGLSLGNTDVTLEALPFRPLHFDGGLALSARLTNGPCRAFNLIYNPAAVRADAQVIHSGPIAAQAGEHILFVLYGAMTLDPFGAFASHEGLVTREAVSGVIQPGSAVLHIRLLPPPPAD